ncbi:MAG: hypothetical protein HC901_04360 [Bdellovibrionaceae bacterium]|nr:hypothetical protein [Pseudobdellovibrionaceae bacterium]
MSSPAALTALRSMLSACAAMQGLMGVSTGTSEERAAATLARIYIFGVGLGGDPVPPVCALRMDFFRA